MAEIKVTQTGMMEVPEYFTSEGAILTYYNRVKDDELIRFTLGEYSSYCIVIKLESAHITEEKIQEISKEQYESALQDLLGTIK